MIKKYLKKWLSVSQKNKLRNFINNIKIFGLVSDLNRYGYKLF